MQPSRERTRSRLRSGRSMPRRANIFASSWRVPILHWMMPGIHICWLSGSASRSTTGSAPMAATAQQPGMGWVRRAPDPVSAAAGGHVGLVAAEHSAAQGRAHRGPLSQGRWPQGWRHRAVQVLAAEAAAGNHHPPDRQ